MRLWHAALAEIDMWVSTAPPDYSKLPGVGRGEADLRRHGAEHVLEVVAANAPARRYSHLHAHTQAAVPLHRQAQQHSHRVVV